MNSLLKLQQADLVYNGVITGRLSAKGPNGAWTFQSVYFQNSETQEHFYPNWGKGNFFVVVPAGKYSIHLGQMISYGYQSQSTVKLDKTSQPFWVNPGEVVYLGDMVISFYKTKGPDYSKASTWLGAMVGMSSSNVKISYSAQNNFEASKAFIQNVRPAGGYQHKSKIVSFGNNEAATEQKVINDGLFIDAGVAESVVVSKLRYEVKGQTKEFKRTTDKVVWYALPSRATKETMAGEELAVEFVAPDKSVAHRETAHVVNELGLMLAEFNLATATPDLRDLRGQWIARASIGKETSEVFFEFSG